MEGRVDFQQIVVDGRLTTVTHLGRVAKILVARPPARANFGVPAMQTTKPCLPPSTRRDAGALTVRHYPEDAPTEPAPAARFAQIARQAMRPPRLPLDLLALLTVAS